MFGIIKLIIWVAGLLVVGYFVLDYFGYEYNKEYFSYSKKECEEKLKECTGNLIHQGIDNVECDFQCIEPKLIIKKK